MSAIITLEENIPPEHGQDYFADTELTEDFVKVERLRDQLAEGESIEPHQVYELAGEIERLWKSEAFRAAYKIRSTFQLVDSAKYFLDKESVHVHFDKILPRVIF